MKHGFLILFLFIFSAGWLWAQTSSTDTSNLVSTQFDTTDFPLWAKDLRRGEIIAFGSFPFAYFFTNFFYDTYRTVSHGGDRRYAPWPIKPAGSIGKTQDEEFLTLGIAAGGAVTIALVDYIIVRYKRYKAAEEIRRLPPGTPIITRRPLGDEAVPPGASPLEPAAPEQVPSEEIPAETDFLETNSLENNGNP
jgi:hypothetical protein